MNGLACHVAPMGAVVEFGGEKRWGRVAIVLGVLAAILPTVAAVTGRGDVLSASILPIFAAVFTSWLHWQACRNRVVFAGDRMWVRRGATVEGPMLYADALLVHAGGPRSNISFLVANRAGVGRSAGRWENWGLPAGSEERQMLAGASVMIVPRLSSRKANIAANAEAGHRLSTGHTRFTLQAAAAASVHG